MTPEEVAAHKAAHPGDVDGKDWSWCHRCRAEWPCLPFRLAEHAEQLAEALAASEAKVARIEALHAEPHWCYEPRDLDTGRFAFIADCPTHAALADQPEVQP